MKIRVLGCSGSIAAGSRTTAFLVDDDLLIDAGTGVGDLSLDELERIDDIVISHSHLDHILGVALLADSVARRRLSAGRPPIVVHALRDTIKALREHVFNGVIWPDFTRLPSSEKPVIAFCAFDVGDVLAMGPRRLEVLSASHTVPAVGFAVQARDGAPAWVFTGDTGPNPKLWQRLQSMPVAHLVIETAFSDEEAALAGISRHHCPMTLGLELASLAAWARPVDIHITHIKPGEVEAVMSQIVALGQPHRIRALTTGQVITLD